MPRAYQPRRPRFRPVAPRVAPPTSTGPSVGTSNSQAQEELSSQATDAATSTAQEGLFGAEAMGLDGGSWQQASTQAASSDQVASTTKAPPTLDGRLDDVVGGGVVLAEGSKGAAVEELQALLGFGAGGQTGTFGPTTKQALLSAQKSLGVQQTGMVGPTTLSALRSRAMAGKAPIIDQYRMNHPNRDGFCGVATLITALEGRGVKTGVDIANQSSLEAFSRRFYIPGRGSTGAGMAEKMRSLGQVDARFTMAGTLADINAQVAAGKPMPVGFVSMHGTVVKAPKDSVRYGRLRAGQQHAHVFGDAGHWATVVGLEGPASNPTAYLVNDSDTGAQLRLTPSQLSASTAAREGIWLIKG